MHEASIAQHIIEQITERIDAGTLPSQIEKIYLKIGKLTAVVPDNLTFMFEVLSRDTALNNVQLVITEIQVRCRCRTCNSEYDTEEVNFWCRDCSSPDVTIISGRELLIASIEVEDADEKN